MITPLDLIHFYTLVDIFEDYGNQYRENIRTLETEDNIYFLKYQDDKDGFLSDVSLFYNTLSKEGFVHQFMNPNIHKNENKEEANGLGLLYFIFDIQALEIFSNKQLESLTEESKQATIKQEEANIIKYGAMKFKK